ncbi:MAG: 2'-5' RNA ligase, partial [uncultured Rubrobacteraceae bacterium]
ARLRGRLPAPRGTGDPRRGRPRPPHGRLPARRARTRPPHPEVPRRGRAGGPPPRLFGARKGRPTGRTIRRDRLRLRRVPLRPPREDPVGRHRPGGGRTRHPGPRRRGSLGAGGFRQGGQALRAAPDPRTGAAAGPLRCRRGDPPAPRLLGGRVGSGREQARRIRGHVPGAGAVPPRTPL